VKLFRWYQRLYAELLDLQVRGFLLISVISIENVEFAASFGMFMKKKKVK